MQTQVHDTNVLDRVQTFEVRIADGVLSDLRERLARTRWIEALGESDGAWDFGLSVPYLRELVTYWRDTYDWRRAEASINRFAQFRADVNGTAIHFLHERGRG